MISSKDGTLRKKRISTDATATIKKQAVSLPQFEFQSGQNTKLHNGRVSIHKILDTRSKSQLGQIDYQNNIQNNENISQNITNYPPQYQVTDPSIYNEVLNTVHASSTVGQNVYHGHAFRRSKGNTIGNRGRNNNANQGIQLTEQQQQQQQQQNQKIISRNIRNTRRRYKILDRSLVESNTQLEPSEVLELFLSDKNIGDIDDSFTKDYSNIYLLELGDNDRIPVWKLGKLQKLKELHVPCNSLDQIFFIDPNGPIDDDISRTALESQASTYTDADIDTVVPVEEQTTKIGENSSQSNQNKIIIINNSNNTNNDQMNQDSQSLKSEDSELDPEFQYSVYNDSTNYFNNNEQTNKQTNEQTIEQTIEQTNGPIDEEDYQNNNNRDYSYNIKSNEDLRDQTKSKELSLFPQLETLNLSFNSLHMDVYGTFYQLSLLTSLKRLNLSSNDLIVLPENLSSLKQLIFLSLEGNLLDERVFYSLSTLPQLEKLNLSRNKIRRVPQISQNINTYDDFPHSNFPCLTMLNLGENLVAYHQDLYNLLHFSILTQIFIWGNPISQSSKELEFAAQELEEKNIQIVLNGPIPPPTKDLSVKNFYSHKLKTIRSYEYVTKQKAPKRSTTSMSESSGFFITETRTVESDTAPDYSNSALTADAQSMDISVTSGNYANNYNIPDQFNFPSVPKKNKTRNTYDYNADWFKLDDALQNLSIDQDDPFYMPEHSMSMRVDKQLSKPKNILKDLKFALDHPLKTVDDRYIQNKFSVSRNPRIEKKQAREQNLNTFYKSNN